MASSIRGLQDNSLNSSAASMEYFKLQKADRTTADFEERLKTAAENKEREDLEKAATEFESYFINMCFKELRKSVPTDGLIPKSNAEQIWQGMLDEEISTLAATGEGGIGLAKMIINQMTMENASYDVPVDPMGRNNAVLQESLQTSTQENEQEVSREEELTKISEFAAQYINEFYNKTFAEMGD